MKNKANFPKAANDQIENIDCYLRHPESDTILNIFDKDPKNSSMEKSNETADEESEWREMNFDLVDLGDDFDVLGSDFDDEQ